MGLILYGDIFLVTFYPVKGKEVSKSRPAVVVSNDTLNKKGDYVVVVPISSRVSKILPYQLKVQKSVFNGLRLDSKLMPETIRSIDKIRILKKIGRLERKYMEHLEGKILYVLNQNAVP